jgi:uncharacterized membrane protein|tara:strand:- start:2942 stop:3184 length:243 start_codon:yes stop_codon:yes gene_type:complete
MEISPYIVWNIFVTLVLAPILFSIRQNSTEIKRQDILINKTREEIAKEYVTKSELKDDMSNIIDRIKLIDEKLDKLFERQ